MFAILFFLMQSLTSFDAGASRYTYTYEAGNAVLDPGAACTLSLSFEDLYELSGFTTLDFVQATIHRRPLPFLDV